MFFERILRTLSQNPSSAGGARLEAVLNFGWPTLLHLEGRGFDFSLFLQFS